VYIILTFLYFMHLVAAQADMCATYWMLQNTAELLRALSTTLYPTGVNLKHAASSSLGELITLALASQSQRKVVRNRLPARVPAWSSRGGCAHAPAQLVVLMDDSCLEPTGLQRCKVYPAA
jgi:hypothetical protein